MHGLVNLRLYKTAKLASFSASPRLFDFIDCETKIETPRELRKKLETARHTEPLKTRL